MSVRARRCASITVLFFGLLLLYGCDQAPGDPPQTDARLAASQTAATKLGSVLKKRLTETIADQGPVAAVAVCAQEAPAIAQRLSEESGATVGRTALKFRNPDNAPTPWQTAVMEAFVAGIDSGADPATLEYTAATADGGYRYMKAIGTAPVCLTCHGEIQPGPLADAIAAQYPADRATGFSAGQLRGAFFVEWSNEK